MFACVAITALVFVVRGNRIRAGRVQYVSNLNEWSVQTPEAAPASPTGYRDGLRRAIVPSHNNESYQWMQQTQQMFAQSDWRVRRVDYENAPNGREVHESSPYRWWLGLVAKIDQSLSGRSIGRAVERAALFADPALHLLLLLSAAAFVAWRFGPIAATLMAVGITALFPFAGGFIPGAPTQATLVQFATLWSLLLLLAGMISRRSGSRRTLWFAASGGAAGFCLWLSVPHALPLIAGTALAAPVAAFLGRRAKENSSASPIASAEDEAREQSAWRAWSYAGAAVSLFGYALEYLPGPIVLRLEVNHPLYALAWLGLGELIQRLSDWLGGRKSTWSVKAIPAVALALAVIAALPIFFVRSDAHLFASAGISETRLNLLSGIAAANLPAWIGRDGLKGAAAFTLLPLVAAVVAIFVLVWTRNRDLRASLAVNLGIVVLCSIQAWFHLWSWNLVDAALLALLVPLSLALVDSIKPVIARSAALLALGVIISLGVSLLWAKAPSSDAASLSDFEGDSYIERDLAHWLAEHFSPAETIVLSPPNLTTTLAFHGGLRGLGTFNWENDQGNTAAIRVVSASSTEEAAALIGSRGITHIVIPSWDTALDDYASLGLRTPVGSNRFASSFIGQLHRWELPAWLRPIPYPLPPNAGVERKVVILQVVEEQAPAVAMSRQAEYFVEMQQLDQAAAMIPGLRHYPGDLSALSAIAYIEAAQGDTAASSATVTKMLPFVGRQSRRPMPFDRRLSLAVLLAQQKQDALAEEQTKRLLAEADEAKLRSVTTLSLYRFHILCKRYNLHLTDPKLSELARRLLRPDLQARL